LKKTIFYYSQLLKIRLSTIVVFSAVAGFLLGVTIFSFFTLMCLIFGGFLVTGSANGFNQILEHEQDKLMERTAVRPLPKIKHIRVKKLKIVTPKRNPATAEKTTIVESLIFNNWL
jgi:heme O synthase-like polyprenyltransferase